MTSSHDQPFGWALIGCGGIGNHHSQWAVAAPDIGRARLLRHQPGGRQSLL